MARSVRQIYATPYHSEHDSGYSKIHETTRPSERCVLAGDLLKEIERPVTFYTPKQLILHGSLGIKVVVYSLNPSALSSMLQQLRLHIFQLATSKPMEQLRGSKHASFDDKACSNSTPRSVGVGYDEPEAQSNVLSNQTDGGQLTLQLDDPNEIEPTGSTSSSPTLHLKPPSCETTAPNDADAAQTVADPPTNHAAAINPPHTPPVNPYETDVRRLPATAPYQDHPNFGRYTASPSDFHPEPAHIQSSGPASLTYWRRFLAARCTPAARVYRPARAKRDMFAVGGVLVKSYHLRLAEGAMVANARFWLRFHAFQDRREVLASEFTRARMGVTAARGAVGVPKVYAAVMLDGGNPVLVVERVEGVDLDLCWGFLSEAQKRGFKEQMRVFMREMRAIPEELSRGLQGELERGGMLRCTHDAEEYEKLMGAEAVRKGDWAFMHNDLNRGNIIVKDDRVVAVVDWELAGRFSFEGVRWVHEHLRPPRRREYDRDEMTAEKWDDLFSWEDLYHVDEEEFDLDDLHLDLLFREE